jgi:beta-glucosidase-like glycosyl hydrolase
MGDEVPYNYIPYSDDNSYKHKLLALRAAQETIVLLKNDGTYSMISHTHIII